MKRLLIHIIFLASTLSVFAQSQYPSYRAIKLVNGDSTNIGTIVDGTIFYSQVSDKFRFRQNGQWVSFSTGSGGAFWPLTGHANIGPGLNTFSGTGAILGLGFSAVGAPEPFTSFDVQGSAINFDSGGGGISLDGTGGLSSTMMGNTTFNSQNFTVAATTAVDVTADGGGINFSSTNDFISFFTNGTERLSIRNNGTFRIAGALGSSGQVITSQGSGGPPIWATPAGTIGGTIAAGQVGFGSGANTLTSDPDFTYDASTNKITPNLIIPLSGSLALTSPDDLTIGATDDIQITGNGDLLIAPGGALTLSAATNQAIIIDASSGTSTIDLNGISGSGISLLGNGNINLAARDFNVDTGIGEILLKTNGTNRLVFENDGSFNVAGSNGTSGQALVSNGSASSPTWQNTIGGSIAANQVAFGSGTNTIQGSSQLQFATGSPGIMQLTNSFFAVNATVLPTTTLISPNEVRLTDGSGDDNVITRAGMVSEKELTISAVDLVSIQGEGVEVISTNDILLGTSTNLILNSDVLVSIQGLGKFGIQLAASSGQSVWNIGNGSAGASILISNGSTGGSPAIILTPDLPTSCAGQATGTWWNNLGMLSICP